MQFVLFFSVLGTLVELHSAVYWVASVYPDMDVLVNVIDWIFWSMYYCALLLSLLEQGYFDLQVLSFSSRSREWEIHIS